MDQLPAIGEYIPAEGGYFFGVLSQADGDYAYYLAPKSAERSFTWCRDADRNIIVAANSALDGAENTAKGVAKGATWYAATYCANYRGAGLADWFLWARKEAELAGRTLGPIDHGSTSTNYGRIDESLPPFASFAVEPMQATIASEFQAGGAQAVGTRYWCSGQEAGTTAHEFNFATGAYTYSSKGLTTLSVRPVRRVRLTSRTRQAVFGSAYQSGAVSFIVPEGVTSISVLVVDAGKNGATGSNGSYMEAGNGGVGGQRGAARYLNDIAVTPGQVIAGYVAPANSTAQTTFGSAPGWQPVNVAPATPFAAQSGTNGTESGPGSNGQNLSGINLITPAVNAGLGSTAWPGGAGGGGGGGMNPGAVGASPPGRPGNPGSNGGIRIIWPGTRRQFPNTFTADESEA